MEPTIHHVIIFYPRTQAGQQFIDPPMNAMDDRYIPAGWDHEESSTAPGSRWVKYQSEEAFDAGVVANLHTTMDRIDEAFLIMERHANAGA
jgi:hypothetical protein